MPPSEARPPAATFFILGAGKAGSTSLHYYLSQHPRILMSEPKEPLFFRLEFENGLDFYRRKYFRGWAGEAQVGDGDPRNLPLPFVTERIARSLPEARFVVLCRNPVERAVSNWWQNVRVGMERRPFAQAMAENLERLRKGPLFTDEAAARDYLRIYGEGGPRELVRHAAYVDAGHYAEHIGRYAGRFGRDRVEVVFFEDLAEDAEAVTARVVRFLGLEPVPLRDRAPQQVATGRLAAFATHHVARLPGVGRLPLSWRKPVHRLLGRIGRWGGGAAPEIPLETRRMLVEHFRPHNERLGLLTGRDLTHWNALPG